VLDVTTDARVLGKTPGKDASAAKATFASILGVEPARQAAAAEAAAATQTLYAAGISSPVLEQLADSPSAGIDDRFRPSHFRRKRVLTRRDCITGGPAAAG
jgi:geranylgeranyl pyrophosphate synthase